MKLRSMAPIETDDERADAELVSAFTLNASDEATRESIVVLIEGNPPCSLLCSCWCPVVF